MSALRLRKLQPVIKSLAAFQQRQINTFALPLTTQLLNQRLQPIHFLANCSKGCCTRNYSSNIQTTPSVASSTTLDAITFEAICEETLDHLTEYFEELVELDPNISKDADISYSSGVLTVFLGEAGTYVINKQSPNKQIWLSSPTSGPKRFDFDSKGECWVYSHTGESLHQVLQAEMPKIFKAVEKIDFSRCCYSKV